MTARRQVGRALRRLGLRRPQLPWVVADGASPRSRLESFRLFGIVSSWMESDVIGAAVNNAFAQGCERVYLVDNDSPDGTVHAAVAAGAILACSFATPRYDERMKYRIMNGIVQDVSAAEPDEHVWWLWLDADEFVHGPGGQTVRDFLATLDRSHRVVGATYLNHYPDRQPAFVPGFHPLEFQPLAQYFPLGMCSLDHRKHPLQRQDRSGPAIVSGEGFHKAMSSERPLREPEASVFVHHFPFRTEGVSRARLEAMFGRAGGESRSIAGDIATGHMEVRLRSLDAVYRHDWAQVENFIPGQPSRGVALAPWTSLVDPEHVPVARWYTAEELGQAVGPDT